MPKVLTRGRQLGAYFEEQSNDLQVNARILESVRQPPAVPPSPPLSLPPSPTPLQFSIPPSFPLLTPFLLSPTLATA